VPIREIRGFDEAKVRVGEGADANTRGRVCSPELQTDTVFLLRVYAPLYTDFPVIAIRRKKFVPSPAKKGSGESLCSSVCICEICGFKFRFWGRFSLEMKLHPPNHVLVVVDLQNDFVTGSLAVRDAAAIVPVINRLRPAFSSAVFTKDWHPANHGSFAANHPGKAVFEQIELAGLPQTLWPVHCVQGTPGAELVAGLDTKVAHVFEKGTDPAIDSYSGFYDNARRRSTGLGEFLKANGVEELFVCGLATDFCVKATAIDAVQLGFKTHLIEDACRGVELQPGDIARAIEAMRIAGVRIITATRVDHESHE